MAAVKELDLTSVSGFTETVDWIRDNIILGNRAERIMQLDVKLSRRTSADSSQISLFVDTKNGYLFAFRGKDKIYVLKDDHQEEYQKLLKENGSGEAVILPGVGSDHRSLGTFLPNQESGGMRGRSYSMAHLQDSEKLSAFSRSGGAITESDVAQAVSVLVCMLAECSRWPSVEQRFQRIYFGENVKADEIFKVYDRAKRILRLADIFPNHRAADRIEKLVKRAEEVKELLARMRTKGADSALTDEMLIHLCLKDPNSKSARDKDAAQRICDICLQLKADAHTMAEILTLCSNEQAVRAAQVGVVG